METKVTPAQDRETHQVVDQPIVQQLEGINLLHLILPLMVDNQTVVLVEIQAVTVGLNPIAVRLVKILRKLIHKEQTGPQPQPTQIPMIHLKTTNLVRVQQIQLLITPRTNPQVMPTVQAAIHHQILNSQTTDKETDREALVVERTMAQVTTPTRMLQMIQDHNPRAITKELRTQTLANPQILRQPMVVLKPQMLLPAILPPKTQIMLPQPIRVPQTPAVETIRVQLRAMDLEVHLHHQITADKIVAPVVITLSQKLIPSLLQEVIPLAKAIQIPNPKIRLKTNKVMPHKTLTELAEAHLMDSLLVILRTVQDKVEIRVVALRMTHNQAKMQVVQIRLRVILAATRLSHRMINHQILPPVMEPTEATRETNPLAHLVIHNHQIIQLKVAILRLEIPMVDLEEATAQPLQILVANLKIIHQESQVNPPPLTKRRSRQIRAKHPIQPTLPVLAIREAVLVILRTRAVRRIAHKEEIPTVLLRTNLRINQINNQVLMVVEMPHKEEAGKIQIQEQTPQTRGETNRQKTQMLHKIKIPQKALSLQEIRLKQPMQELQSLLEEINHPLGILLKTLVRQIAHQVQETTVEIKVKTMIQEIAPIMIPVTPRPRNLGIILAEIKAEIRHLIVVGSPLIPMEALLGLIQINLHLIHKRNKQKKRTKIRTMIIFVFAPIASVLANIVKSLFFTLNFGFHEINDTSRDFYLISRLFVIPLDFTYIYGDTFQG